MPKPEGYISRGENAIIERLRAQLVDAQHQAIDAVNELHAERNKRVPIDVLVAVITALQALEAHYRDFHIATGDDVDHYLSSKTRLTEMRDWVTREFHKFPPGDRGGLYTEYREEVDALRIVLKEH